MRVAHQRQAPLAHGVGQRIEPTPSPQIGLLRSSGTSGAQISLVRPAVTAFAPSPIPMVTRDQMAPGAMSTATGTSSTAAPMVLRLGREKR